MSPLTEARIAEFKERALASLAGRGKAKKYDAMAVNSAHDTSGKPRWNEGGVYGTEPAHPSAFDYSTGGGRRVVRDSLTHS